MAYGQQGAQQATQERINDFLGRFKSNDTALSSEDASTENALDQYLLERTAQELRAAQESPCR